VTESNLQQFREQLKNYEDGPRRRFRVLGPRQRAVPDVQKLASPSGRRRRIRLPFRMPWYALILVASLFFLMKGFVVLRIGEESMRTRLAAYDGANWGERIGVFVMTPDPVSVTLSDWARPVIGAKRRR
jgi:hypothetical protein